MGMSLFISGALSDPKTEAACLDFAATWAQERDWMLEPVKRRLSTVECAGQVLETPQLRGVTLMPHPGCEALPLHFLGPQGVLVDSYLQDLGSKGVKAREGALLKTLFAGVEAHREVCEFLREVRARFLPALVVDDESGYFASSDDAALAAAHESGWTAIRGAFLAVDSSQDDAAEIGGFSVVRSERGGGLAEFALIKAPDSSMIQALEVELRSIYGGLGLQFANNADGLMDLDLLLDEADEQGLAKEPESPAAEQLVHCVGAGFGRTLIALYGGHWVPGNETGLEIADLGGSGLRIDPFQCAADRLMEGPMHSFAAYGAIVAAFAQHLGTKRR